MKRPSEPFSEGSEAAAADPSVVQRYAFIRGEQLDPAEQKDKKLKSLASDKQIRDFKSEAELKSFAGGGTDYIGNVGEEDIWIRFKETGMNLIGEDHEFITLKDVLTGVFALDGGSWVYEGFTDLKEELGEKKQQKEGKPSKELYKEVTHMHKKKGLYKKYKISKDGEEEHAAESILARIGFLLSHMLANGKKDAQTPGKNKLSFEDVPQYNLEVMTMGLKYAWKHAKDVLAEVEDLKEQHSGCFCSGYKPPGKTRALVKVISKLDAGIDTFIENMKYGTFISDNVEGKSEALHDSLVAFAEAMVDHLAFVKSQSGSGTSDNVKSMLQNANTPDEKERAFSALRNERFKKLVLARKTEDEFSIKKAVRYAGMGANHLDAFNDSEWLDRKFDMRAEGSEYKKFKTQTNALKQKAVDAPGMDKQAESAEIELKPSSKKEKKSAKETTDEKDKPPRKKKQQQQEQED